MIIIIGSGLAGFTLVREIRKINQDCEVAVITQDDGHYYSKPQLSTALTHQKTAEQLILIRREKFESQFKCKIYSNIHVNHLSEVSNIIPEFSLDDFHQKGFQVVLALGSNPVRLASLQNHPLNIHSINQLKDYKLFREQLKQDTPVHIIGVGLVGCEFANDLLLTGHSVTLTAPEAYPLSKLVPSEVGMELSKAFKEKGLNLQLNQFFDPQKISGDTLIISATGLQAEITLAKNAGIDTNIGIKVDNTLQTNIPGIYALGDCAEFNGQVLPYIAPIALGARALAKTLLGIPTSVVYPAMPIYVKTSLYPIVILSPPVEAAKNGHWKIEKILQNEEQQLHGVRGLFYNESDHLKGFVLSGNLTCETNDWLGQIHEN